jgi:hypothetical protein
MEITRCFKHYLPLLRRQPAHALKTEPQPGQAKEGNIPAPLFRQARQRAHTPAAMRRRRPLAPPVTEEKKRRRFCVAAGFFVGRDQTSIAVRFFVGRDQTSIAV